MIRSLIDGAIKPLIDKMVPLEKAGKALRYLIEQRPFGQVILTIGHWIGFDRAIRVFGVAETTVPDS